MNTKNSKQKKPNEADTSSSLALTNNSGNKIPQKLCLSSSKFDGMGKTHYFLKAKRKYFPVLRFREEYDAKRLSFRFLKLIKKMKYLKRLELSTYAMRRPACMKKLTYVLPRIESVQIGFYSFRSYSYSLLPHKGPIFKDFAKNARHIKLKALQNSYLSVNDLEMLIQQLNIELKTIANLKTFHLYVPPSMQFQGGTSNPLKQLQFKRLRKLENVQAIVAGPSPVSAFECFTDKFEPLPQLKSLEVISKSELYGKKLIENLIHIKTLRSITIYHSVEPNDILSLAIYLPYLEKIYIKDDWIFTSKSMPLLDKIKPQDIKVTHLHLDLPIDLDNQQDVKFTTDFLSVFPHLESLKLYLRPETLVQKLISPIAKMINKLTKLQELTLGIQMLPGAYFKNFLGSIDKLTGLRKLCLMLKTSGSWDKELQSTLETLKSFLFQSKLLRHLELYWEKITPSCIEFFNDTRDNLSSLDFFKFYFLSPYKCHGKNHDQILHNLQKVLLNFPQSKEIIIATRCGKRQGRNGTCISEINKIIKLVAPNKNIKYFAFMSISRVETCFLNELLHFDLDQVY